MNTSDPCRTPESKTIGTRPATRSTIVGSTSSVGTDWSIWRPPWFEIQMPSIARVEGPDRVVGVHDPLQDDGQRRPLPGLGQVAPGEGRRREHVEERFDGGARQRRAQVLAQLDDPVIAAPLRAMRTPAATAFGVSLTGGRGAPAAASHPAGR